MSLAKALQNAAADAPNIQSETDEEKQCVHENNTIPNRLERQSNSLPNNRALNGFNMMQKTLDNCNNVKSDRELKHTTMKLNDIETELTKSMKVIKQLKKQNEDLLTEKEIHENEIKTLKERNKLLQDMYDMDTAKQNHEIYSIKTNLTRLQNDITQKNNELNAVNELQKAMQQQIYSYVDDDEKKHILINKSENNMNNGNNNMNINNAQIINLLSELNELRNLKSDKLSLQNEINKLNEMAQNDLIKMNEEMMELKSKNETLQREKDELILLSEDTKGTALNRIPNNKFKTSFDSTHKLSFCSDQSHPSSLSQNGLINLEEFYENKNDFIDYGQYAQYTEYAEYQHEKLENPLTLNPKKEKKIADVSKEYLHLTACVVKMKFGNKVPHITSKELIERVSSFHFCHYHDMMVTIMKHEQKKIRQKKIKQNQNKNNAKKTGIFNVFKNRFRSNDS